MAMNITGLLSDPTFAAGMGLLEGRALSRTPPNPAQNVMQNLYNAQQVRRQMEMDAIQKQLYQAQMYNYTQPSAAQFRYQDKQDELKKQEIATEALVKKYPEYEAIIRANPVEFAKQAAEGAFPSTSMSSGKYDPSQMFNQQWLVDQETGEVTVAKTNKGGVTTYEKVSSGAPASILAQDPANQGAIATEKAIGTETGKTNAERTLAAPANIQGIDNVLKQIEYLETHPGDIDNYFGWVSGALPTIRQSSVDVGAKIEQIRANLSLEARQKLKGSGTISDFEFKILEKSVTILSQPRISTELALKEIDTIKQILNQARDRNESYLKTSGSQGGWSIEEIK